MSYKIIISDASRQKLKQIASYIAQDRQLVLLMKCKQASSKN